MAIIIGIGVGIVIAIVIVIVETQCIASLRQQRYVGSSPGKTLLFRKQIPEYWINLETGYYSDVDKNQQYETHMYQIHKHVCI